VPWCVVLVQSCTANIRGLLTYLFISSSATSQFNANARGQSYSLRLVGQAISPLPILHVALAWSKFKAALWM
jgi:hypothetical protein